MTVSRRSFLTLAALSTTGWTVPYTRAATTGQAPAQQKRDSQTLAVPDRLSDHLQVLFGDGAIPIKNVTLSLPALAENGNSVALGVTVDATVATTTGSAVHLTNLYLFAEKNPLPDIARFEFFAPHTNTTTDLETRIRLSDSQRIIAVAKYSDGTLSAGEAPIVVTLAACIDLPS